MGIKGSKGIGTLAAIAAMVAMAVGATSASATVVTPAATPITATNVTNTILLPANAYAETSTQCTESKATFTTPSATDPIAANKNQTTVGPFSTGPGSVTMALTSQEFNKCSVYAWNGTEWVDTTVPVSVTTSGTWSVSASSVPGDGTVSIAVPPGGAVVEIDTGCDITISPGQASAVGASYDNESGILTVDGQIANSSPESCGGPSPAQFEGKYELNNGFEINP